MERKKYSIIYADPPWSFGTRKLNAGKMGKEVEDHYPVMSDEDILSLPIKSISAEDSVIFMWVVYSKLPLALKVMERWGFKYSTVGFEWLKRTSTGKPVCFMGPNVCGGAIELCLMGRRGCLPRINKNIRRLIDSPRSRHSEKPSETRNRIVDLFGDLPRVELFAREKKEGWDSWGNELPNDVELNDPDTSTEPNSSGSTQI